MPYALLALIGRLVSVAAGAGTLLAIYACGARAFGKRAGVFAGGDVRAGRRRSCTTRRPPTSTCRTCSGSRCRWCSTCGCSTASQLRDFVGVRGVRTLAICTKDQAYGLYLLTPLAIVHRLWQANREAGEPHPLVRALFDRRLRWAAVVAVGLFACVHNIVVQRARVLGPRAAHHRPRQRNLSRLRADARRAARAVPADGGHHPRGLGLADVSRQRPPASWSRWSTPRVTGARACGWRCPVVSYYLAFINVVLYNYDRFMLPVCLVLSLFGGLALDRWLAGHRWPDVARRRRGRRVCVHVAVRHAGRSGDAARLAIYG